MHHQHGVVEGLGISVVYINLPHFFEKSFERKENWTFCSLFDFSGFDSVRLPNLSVQFSYSQRLMIRQNASLTKRNNATQPTSKKKGKKKKRQGQSCTAWKPSMYQWWGLGGWTSLCLSSRSSEAEIRGWRSAKITRMGLVGPLNGFSAWSYWLVVCLKPLNRSGF